MHAQTEYLIGMDLGTSSIKAVLCDSDGNLITKGSTSTTLINPAKSRVEIDPEQYFLEFTELVNFLVSKVDNAEEIKAICLSGATGNTLLINEVGNPLGNAISWLDTRTLEEGQDPWPHLDKEHIYYKNGWPYFGTFPLAHLGWLKKNQPETWVKAKRFAMLHDFIFHKLCGDWVMDHSKATTFYLQDQVAKKWNPELLDSLGIHEDQLPRLCESGEPCGALIEEARKITELTSNTQVVTGSFDHPSAARGTGVFNEGDMLISAGTSWVVFTPIREREIGLSENMLIDPFLSPNGCWGAIFALTAVGEKLENLLSKIIPNPNKDVLYEEFNQLAMEAEPGAGETFINLLNQTEIEYEGIARSSSPQNVCRALMEGIVFQTSQRVKRVAELTGTNTGKLIFTGGPTKSKIWSTILADVLNREISIPINGEYAGAMGAVNLGGIGCGIYKDEQSGFEMLKQEVRVIAPDAGRSKKYEEIQTRFFEQTIKLSN